MNTIRIFAVTGIILFITACKQDVKTSIKPVEKPAVTAVTEKPEEIQENCKVSSPVYYELVEFLEKDGLKGMMNRKETHLNLGAGSKAPVQYHLDYKSRDSVNGKDERFQEMTLRSFCLENADAAKDLKSKISASIERSKLSGLVFNHNQYVLYLQSKNEWSNESVLSYKERINELVAVMD